MAISSFSSSYILWAIKSGIYKINHNKKYRVDQELKNFRESVISYGQKYLKVHRKLILSMIDGRISKPLTDVTPYGGTSKEFNNIDKMVSLQVKSENLEFGLSIVHRRIRFFECLASPANDSFLRNFSWQLYFNTQSFYHILALRLISRNTTYQMILFM